MHLLVQALVAGLFGTYFTHRIFAQFVLAAMRANHAISRGGDYTISERELVSHTLHIALGLVPLGYGIVCFIRWTWLHA